MELKRLLERHWHHFYVGKSGRLMSVASTNSSMTDMLPREGKANSQHCFCPRTSLYRGHSLENVTHSDNRCDFQVPLGLIRLAIRMNNGKLCGEKRLRTQEFTSFHLCDLTELGQTGQFSFFIWKWPPTLLPSAADPFSSLFLQILSELWDWGLKEETREVKWWMCIFLIFSMLYPCPKTHNTAHCPFDSL